MTRTLRRLAPSLLLLVLSACGLARCTPAPLDRAALDGLYARPLPPPAGPLAVYFVGHSLVGRDMPAMLAELAPAGHRYESELGWGANLKSHWGDAEIAGFAQENAHPRYRDAQEATGSGDYDAFVFTEMLNISTSLRYYDTPGYLHRFAARIREARPDARIFLYETWRALGDPEGWMDRFDPDLTELWEGGILAQTLAYADTGGPIHVIPAGQVLARVVRAVEARPGGIDGVASRSDLFSDDVHLNDIGAYLVAVTHHAVLYQRDPAGLPRQLHRADGTPAVAPGPELAALIQATAWDVVTHYPKTGVPQEPSAAGGPADG